MNKYINCTQMYAKTVVYNDKKVHPVLFWESSLLKKNMKGNFG